ncbi:hypothetical protein P691DRAFT_807605 [Macrolepiota fuliginosa MF-IS2]|uniref:HCP-like protein n=1 Tax=Macrolepiota fuliginosa MF-IS2 TaxID=1400762 RepID=A0A9P6C7P8_9AGAR|nr:hypothetical protein P691DRAFT_807605 [Macrolepiota fuliginosa MF-IS2]
MGRSKLCARKASWLAFGLVAFSIVCSATHDLPPKEQESLSTITESPLATPLNVVLPSPDVTQPPSQETQNEAIDVHAQRELDQAAEGARAYRRAAAALAALTAHPPSFTFDPLLVTNGNSKSILSSFLPNLQGQGPIGSALRILMKLHYHTVRRLTMALGLGQETVGMSSRRRDEEQRVRAVKVLDLLLHSVDLGNTDALFTLAKVSLFPPTQYFPEDTKLAYDSFSTLASRTGNATAQAYLAFFHATGYHNIVPVDPAKAQLYFTFAANGGDRGAQMALAYRYWSGIGTSENCERASAWYGTAAEQAMARYMSGPPGGRTLPQTSTRLSDLTGGIYGPGASVASTGLSAQRPAIKAGIARAAGETWEDVIDYYQFNADRGEIDFAYRLGKIFYQGSIYASPGGIASGSEGVGAIPRNYARARHYFLQIARQVWPHDPPNAMQVDSEQKPIGYAAISAGYLGRMYLRGEGVKQDYTIAKAWFERGAVRDDKECHNGLGIIYRDGLGVKSNLKAALKHFTAAASQDLAEAQVNLGKYHYNKGEIAIATSYFESALRNGSPFEAYYYLAEVQATQAADPTLPSEIISSSCSVAVSFYKIVAERGVWDEDLLSNAERAWMSGTEQGKDIAMLNWWLAAERGFEVAQNNLAYVLDQDKSMLRLTRFAPTVPSNDTARLALTQWTRAAGQRNIDALIKVGDYYYHGLGISDDETGSGRLEKAASYYQSAADTQLSALALWNLGWMYENGVGVPQDYHLAKRHYDMALEINSEAYMPVTLSLFKLYARSIWHTLRGGKDGLNLWNSDEEDKEFIAKVKEAKEIDDGQRDVRGEAGTQEEDRGYHDEDDDHWYMGKAKDDFHRRRQDSPDRRGENEDPVQWARDRRNAEQEHDSYFGPEDYFEGALRNGRVEEGGDGVDDFFETMMLVALCLLVSVLLYIRTRIVERMRREQQQQQQQDPPANGNHGQAPAQAGGVFPPPGDPARNDWAILR